MNYETPITGETAGSISSDYSMADEETRAEKTKWLVIGGVLIAAVLALAWWLMSNGEAGSVAAGDDR